MTRAASWRVRWSARTSAERAALVEAFAMLMIASLIVRFLPFRHIARIARRSVVAPAPSDPAVIVARVAWAVGAAARRARFRAVCIERGLAAQAMLRRRGIATQFHYGVARRDGDLSAHVWVTWEGHEVVGGREAPDFREMAIFAPTDTANRIG